MMIRCRFIALILLTAMMPAYGFQASASTVTLTYQAHKKILHLGEMVMSFTALRPALPQSKYRLTMSINGNRILKNRTQTLSSSGVLDERLNLMAEEFIDKKYRILFENGRVAEIYRKDILQPAYNSTATDSPILDPVSAIWQIMPKLAEKPKGTLCADMAISYFNGKHLYQLTLSDAPPLKLGKKHATLQASHVTSCVLHRSKNGAKDSEATQQSKLILIEAAHYPHPLIYQFYNQDKIRFTLHAIDIAP